MQLAVATGTVDCAGVEHAISNLEAANGIIGSEYRTDRIPAEDFRLAGLRLTIPADLGINRIDGDGRDLDEQVVWQDRLWVSDAYILQGQ